MMIASGAGPESQPQISYFDELQRKGIHLVSISIPVGYQFLDRNTALCVMAFVSFGMLLFETVRIFRLPGHSLQSTIFGKLYRAHEDRNLAGAYYILAGAFLAILLFSKPIAVACIAFAVLGDTAAALVGRRWGRLKFRGKSVEGSLSCLAACAIAGALVPDLRYSIAFAGAFAATLLEAFSGPLDDNMAVILGSGGIMTLLTALP